MGWSGGVLKGSCAAFGEEGQDLARSPRTPFASSWILTPITDPGTEKDAKVGGRKRGGEGSVLTLEAVFTQDIHCFLQYDLGVIKYCLML